MNINMIAPINMVSYGIASLNIIKSLHNAGHHIALRPVVERVEVETQDTLTFIQQLINNAKEFDHDAPCVRIWHQHDMGWFIGHGPHIGFSFFELDRFTPQEIHNLSYCDHIFCTSQWAADIIEDNIFDSSPMIVPLGHDPTIFFPQRLMRAIERDGIYRFINIGKLEDRKGHDFLAKCFRRAFPHQQHDVRLVMASSSPFATPQEVQEHHRAYQVLLGNRVEFVPRLGTSADLASLIHACDCAVFPSRAEGWNLPLLESMACGLPCIATNYSAHTEFIGPASDNMRHIDIYDLEPAIDGKFFSGNGQWAKFGPQQEEQLIEHMREMYEDKKGEALDNNQRAMEFTWQKSAEKLVGHLEAIQASECV